MHKNHILLLILLVLAPLAPFLIQNGFLGDMGDPIGQTIPNKFLLITYLKEGILPFWNPLSFMGYPLLADIQVGTFYLPDILLFSLAHPLLAHNLSVVFHFIFAALGTYFFTKKLTGQPLAAAALSLTLVFSSSFLGKIVYLNFLETISYLPWMLYAIFFIKKPIPLLGGLTALMLFAGHPIAAFYVVLILGGVTLLKWHITWRTLHIAAGVLIGILLAGIQILPFLALKQESLRDTLTYETFTEGSLTRESLRTLFIPSPTLVDHPFDLYLHFGVVPLFLVIIAILYLPEFSREKKHLYLIGLVLAVVGLIFALGDNVPLVAKTLYNLPFFNIIRVPARYIIIVQIGVIFSLAALLAHLYLTRKKLATALSLLILINAVLLPSFMLTRFATAEARAHYMPGIAQALKEQEGIPLSLYAPPRYVLSSSFFLFPNRHLLTFLPNMIGYNPLMLRRFHEHIPVEPVGAFDNPEYFMNLYEKFSEFGLHYYIFPTENFLKTHAISDKTKTIEFLKTEKWKPIFTLDNALTVWKHPDPTPFVRVLAPENSVDITAFSPGEITMQTKLQKEDTLIVNQSYARGWRMETAQGTHAPAPYKELVQQYHLTPGTTELTLRYTPPLLREGALVSLIGALLLLLTLHHGKPLYRGLDRA